jgi:NO-binding membrane sensor protein with MHYT domain
MTGGYHSLLSGDYYSSALLARALGLGISCAGTYLGLRCASRARACSGAPRARWLLLAGVSTGAVAIWATDFIAMLGFSVPGQTVRYSVPVTLLSLLVAVVVMCLAFLTAGLGRIRPAALIAGSVIAGSGIAFSHYLGVAAIRMSAQISYDPSLFIVSVVIAILAAAAVLWAAARLSSPWPAVGAALVVGIVISGMHDAGTAAVRLSPANAPGGMVTGGGSGATAESFLLPLFIGLSVMLFLASAAIVLSPTEEAMRYDQSLLDSIRLRARASLEVTPLRPPSNAGRNGTAVKASPPWTITSLGRPSAQK